MKNKIVIGAITILAAINLSMFLDIENNSNSILDKLSLSTAIASDGEAPGTFTNPMPAVIHSFKVLDTGTTEIGCVEGQSKSWAKHEEIYSVNCLNMGGASCTPKDHATRTFTYWGSCK